MVMPAFSSNLMSALSIDFFDKLNGDELDGVIGLICKGMRLIR